MAETLKSVASYFPLKGGIIPVAVILIAAVLHTVKAVPGHLGRCIKRKQKNPTPQLLEFSKEIHRQPCICPKALILSIKWPKDAPLQIYCCILF